MSDSFWNTKLDADDWGLSPAINRGIVEIGRCGGLRSVSCMAGQEFLQSELLELKVLVERGVKLYLHFNLTYGAPIVASEKIPSLLGRDGKFCDHQELIKRCFLGRINADEIRIEFEAQLQNLIDLGLPVVGVTGHHHVHMLPVVGNIVIELMRECGLQFLREMSDMAHPSSFFQSVLFRFSSKRNRRGIQFEKTGYLLPKDLRNKKAFEAKINKFKGDGVLIHPAIEDDFDRFGVTDSLRNERVEEFKSLLNYCRD